jgi:thiamine-phosphate pyrophosphorylase
MPRCYSEPMQTRQSAVGRQWLVSDRRNDAALKRVLTRLPRGSGLVFRHYHLGAGARRARWRELQAEAARYGHDAILSGSAREARRWGADGAYGPPALLARGPALLRLVTVHSLRELAAAHRARADAVLLSPVFATQSHPGAKTLGPLRFRAIASHALVPVIALGGMNAKTARRLGAARWAAIDGFCQAIRGHNCTDS